MLECYAINKHYFSFALWDFHIEDQKQKSADFTRVAPDGFSVLHVLQVLVTDFSGSVMGIKHTEAAYVGFTGRYEELLILEKLPL